MVRLARYVASEVMRSVRKLIDFYPPWVWVAGGVLLVFCAGGAFNEAVAH